MKRLLVWFVLLMCLCMGAKAETMVIGGSKEDAVMDIAVGDDGRVVLAGYTASSDGTLSDRSKSGRSGWVACYDAQGNLLWNFCSRHDAQDMMRHPVIHEDGTISVILISVNSVHEQVGEEWIHLSAEGNVIEREQIPGSGGVLFFVSDRGYIQAETGETERRFYLIEWGGVTRKPIHVACDASTQIEEVSGTYFIAESFDMGKMLFAMDEALGATQWKERAVVPEERVYRRILALRDGTLAAIGYEGAGFSAKRVFTRWDAAGNVLADVPYEADMPRFMDETEDGIVTLNTDGDLIWLDCNGQVRWRKRTEMSMANAMAAAPGGRIIAADDRGKDAGQDVYLHTQQLPQ